MPETDAVFFVNAYDDPVQLIIRGRASFQNARPVSELFTTLIKQGRRTFVVDLGECMSMDSTFLGILAGAGIRLKEKREPGRLILTRLSDRNRDLVENLGLDHIVEIDRDNAAGPSPSEVDSAEKLEERRKASAAENSHMVLKAHEDLVRAQPANERKFQDVIHFLRSQTED
ncbi:MAG: STAS domain-containing protein [Opitutales bacterium]